MGFEFILPVSDDVCRRNIAASLARKHVEAVTRRHITVIANGPSARDADLRAISGPTLALNGAVKLFLDQGAVPTFWAVCDPQEHVAEFLPDNPPKETVYFVASKCHQRVFDKLAGRDVRLWHLIDHDAPGCARIGITSSITGSASWLMHRLGFTDFEYWGWDCCFIEGRHHASSETSWGTPPLYINYGGEICGGEVIGGRTFATTRTWAAEVDGACQFFHLCNYFDIGVTIHGDGMVRQARASLFETLKDQAA